MLSLLGSTARCESNENKMMLKKAPVDTDVEQALQSKRRTGSLFAKINENAVARTYATIRLVFYLCICTACVVLFLSVSIRQNLDIDLQDASRLFRTGVNGFDREANRSEAGSTLDTVRKRLKRVLPSLNLNDYKESPVFPVFASFPQGIRRSEMPQFTYNPTSMVWKDFETRLKLSGGFISNEKIDLRKAVPLQSELSGFIIYNVLFGDRGELVRKRLRQDKNWFRKRIVLMRTPTELPSIDGSVIKRKSLLILDGHHTTTVAQLCAEIITGDLHSARNASCGRYFDPRQSVRVIDGLHPLVVRKLALESGAKAGYHMNHFKPSRLL